MSTHTIAVISGTGKSGRYLVQKLLENNYSIKLLLRSPENSELQNPLFEIIKGDARDYHSITKLLEGCNVVVSTLGQPKEEKSIFSDATNNIIKAMEYY
ncbi:NAD(P)-dependent oxidoreductase [Chryseobacterium zhengzhouense]|uniref:NAD(P)-dependent oxidoreductase n=1 Tax=Chryseobacterium zhengzhouense TaxID=1636086 RepID=A0ABW2LUH9_9FLAO